LNASVDEQLLQLLRAKVNINGNTSNNSNNSNNSNVSNVNYLLSTCSEAIMKVLSNTPDTMSTSWLLFLNRPLPLSLRPYLWCSKMQVEARVGVEGDSTSGTGTGTGPGSGSEYKISPSVDMLYSRRIHVLLDK